MFDFFEVPSQAIGAIGPVAQGTNFDWVRQDIKPGLMNVNLIIDEEAFFSRLRPAEHVVHPDAAQRHRASAVAQHAVSALPMTTQRAPMAHVRSPPIPYGWSPIPLVVSAFQANGAPNYVYPLVDQTTSTGIRGQGPDPDGVSTPVSRDRTTPTAAPGVGNRIKAAFAQFLWLRHGGSGYLFGHGAGATGQNTSVVTLNPNDHPAQHQPDPGRSTFPLAVVPGHQLHDHASRGTAAFDVQQSAGLELQGRRYNAAALYTAQTPTTVTVNGQSQNSYYFLSPNYYAPYVSTKTPTSPIRRSSTRATRACGTRSYPRGMRRATPTSRPLTRSTRPRPRTPCPRGYRSRSTSRSRRGVRVAL